MGAAVRRCDLPREEARISTTIATVEDKASPGATPNLATSGGRTEVLRSEVTAMDGRQGLRARKARTARSTREQGRSEGTRSAAEGRMWEPAVFGGPVP